jgi:uncharacterized membrane protein YeaQ/YmgE (transglycosylase-associated protein family)
MNIIVFLVIGLIAGWIAGLVMEGHGLGTLADIIIGVIGAFVGGFIFNMLGVIVYGFWGSVGMSAVGAIVFLFLARLISGSQKPSGKL